MIRQALNLTHQELSNRIGIPIQEYIAFERGKETADDFLSERMRELFGIDMESTQSKHRIVFSNPTKVSPAVFVYLNTLDFQV